MAIEFFHARKTAKLSKAFVGYWIGFLATFGIYFELYQLVCGVLQGDSRQPPPILGLVLSATAPVVGKHMSVWFERFDPTAAAKKPGLASN